MVDNSPSTCLTIWEVPNMAVGRVKAYRPHAGFGFIAPSHNCGDVFVEVADIEEAGQDLVPGEVVEYDPEVGVDGQLKAVHVHVVGHPGD